MMNRVLNTWCRLMHSGIINLIHGHYQCAICHRMVKASFK